jgi:hypothetical protein
VPLLDAPPLDVVPPLLDVVPPLLDVVPPLLDVVPPLLDVVPPLLDAVPPLLDAVPPLLDAVPPSLDAVPPLLDVASVEDVIPPSPEFSPKDVPAPPKPKWLPPNASDSIVVEFAPPRTIVPVAEASRVPPVPAFDADSSLLLQPIGAKTAATTRQERREETFDMTEIFRKTDIPGGTQVVTHDCLGSTYQLVTTKATGYYRVTLPGFPNEPRTGFLAPDEPLRMT